MRSSGSNFPDFRYIAAFFPKGVLFAASSRSICPEEKCGTSNFFDKYSAKVPLPLAGGPSNITFIFMGLRKFCGLKLFLLTQRFLHLLHLALSCIQKSCRSLLHHRKLICRQLFTLQICIWDKGG